MPSPPPPTCTPPPPLPILTYLLPRLSPLLQPANGTVTRHFPPPIGKLSDSCGVGGCSLLHPLRQIFSCLSVYLSLCWTCVVLHAIHSKLASGVGSINNIWVKLEQLYGTLAYVLSTPHKSHTFCLSIYFLCTINEPKEAYFVR
jgi:hypothetical protein